jgi:hypothetical protein
MNPSDLLAEISAFQPQNGDWRPLGELLGQLWSAGVAQEGLPVLFGVFERYPGEDGAGVLWSVVHGVESLNLDYGQSLRDSMSRQASLMGRIMLDRLERSIAAG